MLKVFYFLLCLGISQSLAVISNAQQDLAVKSIVYKQPSNLYVPVNLQPQYQPSVHQNSASSSYNGPSYQYLPISTNQNVITTPSSNRPSNGLSQYQPTSQQNVLPSNYNQYSTSSSKQQVHTSSSSNVPSQPEHGHSPPSNYNGPSHQYSPSTSKKEVSTSTSSNGPTQPQQYQQTYEQNSPPSNYNGPSNQYSSSSSTSTSSNRNELSQYQPNFEQNSPPSNYNGPSHQYLPSPSKQEVHTTTSSNGPIQPQHGYQPTSQQNSPPSNYNGPSHQYSPSPSKEEVNANSNSYGNSLPQNGLSHNQPTSEQNSLPSNYNGPSSLRQEINTTPRTNPPSPPSSYYGPAHQYLPATPEVTQTTTPLSIAADKKYSANYSFNHYNHWNPIKDQRQQQPITNNLRPNVQPPIELHHGYRYMEPAHKINTTNFQPLTGVKYNELGLGQNNTNTSELPENYARPSNTEFQTHQGYIYGNSQYSQHYPNTTVLRPVPTPEQNYHQQNHNRFETHASYKNNTQETQQQEKPAQNAIPLQEQYPNHRYPNSELNSQQQPYPSSTTSSGNKATAETSQHSNSKPTNQQTSSQSGSFSNKVNQIANSNNNIISPQTEPNRFIAEVTQQMTAQNYPYKYASNQISSSNTEPNVQQVSNQYYNGGNQQSSPATSQQNPLNYEPSKGIPSVTSSFNRIPTSSNYRPSFIANVQTQNNQHVSQTRPISDGSANRQPNVPTQNQQLEIDSNQYSSQSISQTSSSSDLSSPIVVANNMPNGPTQSNRYDSATNPSNQQQQKPDQHYSTTFQQPSQVTPNLQTQNNKFVSSSHLVQASNQNQQNTESQGYYGITSHQPTQASNTRPNVQTQSSTQQSINNQEHSQTFNTRPNIQTQSLHQQSTYPANQNQHPTQASNTRPNVQTQSSTQQSINNQEHSQTFNTRPNIQTQSLHQQSTYPANQNQQPSQATNTRPNAPTQSATQQPIHPSYQSQQNTVTNYGQTPLSNYQNGYYSTSSQQSNPASPNAIIRPNVQIESKPIYSTTFPQQQSNQHNPNTPAKPSSNADFSHYYYNNPQQSNGMPQTTTASKTRPIVATESQQFFPNTDQQSGPSSNPIPIGQAQSNQVFFTPQQSSLSFPHTSSTFNQLVANSNATETPKYRPHNPNIYQNQQNFLAKPTQTNQVPTANTVGHFFGQTSAISTTASVSASNNGNIIQHSTEQKPVDLMGNSNYLQMQSHSFEMPYYYTMQTQPNFGQIMQQLKPTAPVAALVEPRRLPHLTYGAPVNEPSKAYLPPSSLMQAPYF